MSTGPTQQETTDTRPTLRALLLYFLRLGTFGFGGPIALVGYMQRDLVEEKKWVSKEDYFEGLAFSQLCPGPLAAQLAKYIGWLHSGTVGATLTGAAKWTIQTTTANSKIFRFRRRSTAWPLMPKRTVFTHRSRKRMAKPLRAWWFTKLFHVELSAQREKIDVRRYQSAGQIGWKPLSVLPSSLLEPALSDLDRAPQRRLRDGCA